jgi:hypothetical protein
MRVAARSERIRRRTGAETDGRAGTAMTPTRTSSEEAIHALAMRTPTSEIAAYLQDLFGQKLTAVVAGVQDPKVVGKWARGEQTPRAEARQRLRAAYYIARLLMEVEDAETVEAWFAGMNPHLHDQPPALVIREDPLSVLIAARAFLAGG